jgi:hypothetical protein
VNPANPSTATEIIVALSIFVPVIAAAALTAWVLLGRKRDPDHERLRRQQAEYEARRDRDR